MRIDLTTLRQRAAQIFGSDQLRRRSALLSEHAPALPATTPHLFTLAQIAVGDAESAAVLTADVLARHLDQPDTDDELLVRTMVERLPEGWLSWPSETGPGEWLPLGVRREQADRLLSLLGEWEPTERIGLALYLLWDVRRDDLDSWLGTSGLADRLGQRINSVGQSLGRITLSDTQVACADLAPDLVDADDPQIGRSVRRHTLGCEACRQRVTGLRQTTQVLRRALNAFFRARPPARLPALIAEQRRQQQQIPIKRWQLGLASAIVVLLLLRSWGAAPEASSARPGATAQREAAHADAPLLDRALDRFGVDAPSTGVLHERIRFRSGDETLVLERWYDYTAPQRLRVTVRRPETTVPILDLSTDGTSRIAYELDRSYRTPSNAQIRDPDTRALMPLLRQLPYTGGLGDTRIEQRHLDLTLLAQARRNGATPLGTTIWQGRPAAIVSSTADDGSRMILTVDQATASLLEARVMPDRATAAEPRTVWQADLFEVVTRAELPRGLFELSPRKNTLSKINPRQFMLSPLANLNMTTALAVTSLPLPRQLPEPSILAYVRSRDRGYSSMLQIYESQWSSAAIVTPRQAEQAQQRTLDQRFAHGRYALIEHNLPDATAIEFSMSGAQDKRMRLYLWHGLFSTVERQSLARAMLDSLVLVDTKHPLASSHTFLPSPGAGRSLSSPTQSSSSGSSGSGQAFILTTPAPRRSSQPAIRAKSRQLLQLEIGPLEAPPFLSR